MNFVHVHIRSLEWECKTIKHTLVIIPIGNDKDCMDSVKGFIMCNVRHSFQQFQPCPAGQVPSGGLTACNDCGLGQYRGSGDGSCQPCPKGNFLEIVSREYPVFIIFDICGCVQTIKP